MEMANEAHQRLLNRRKMNGLCIDCNNPLDRDGVRCVSCNDNHNNYNAETRKFYQSMGICPRCRKNNLYGNEKVCIECSYKLSEEVMRTRDKNNYNKKHAEWSRRTHKEMVEKGICYRCRKRKADYGFKTCGICRTKHANYVRMKNQKPDRKERYKQGLCYFCDNEIKPGYKVCEVHYQRNVDNARSQKAKEARKELVKQGVLY